LGAGQTQRSDGHVVNANGTIATGQVTPAPAGNTQTSAQSAIINNAVKAATELDKKFPEVATHNNPALLLKNQGPSHSQYQALYALFSNPNILEHALRTLDPKTAASLLRWHVDTSGVTLERKSSLEFVPTDAVSINIVGNTVNIHAAFAIGGEPNTRSQTDRYSFGQLAMMGFNDISGRYWIDGRWITVNMHATDYGPLGHTTAPRGQNLVEVKIVNRNDASNVCFGIFGEWSRQNPGYMTLYTGYTIRPGTTRYISDTQFRLDSLHELGHILGVGDAYRITDSELQNRPNASVEYLHIHDIMRSGQYGRQFSAFTIGSILHAQATNQYQQMPR
jgi:hypothetical protein